MQRFSCDACQRDLIPSQTVHYSLRMEARILSQPSLDDTTLEIEHLDPVDAMEDYLAESDTCDDSGDDPLPVLPLNRTYDLCSGCYQRVQSDPLGLDRSRRFEFRNN